MAHGVQDSGFAAAPPAAVATASRRQPEQQHERPRRRRWQRHDAASSAAAESGFVPASRRRQRASVDEKHQQQQAARRPPKVTTNMSSTATASAPATKKPPPALASALAGGASGALISACVQPLDVLRTRLQAEAALGAAPRSAAAALRGIVAVEGVRGLWRGTGPTVVRLSLGAALNFVALERLKAAALSHAASAAAAVEEEEKTQGAAGRRGGQGTRKHGDGSGSSSEQKCDQPPPRLGVWQAAAVGGLARALSAAVMSPVTLVKTRMEYGGAGGLASAAAASSSSPSAAAAAAAAAGRRYQNTWHALATIAREEGGLRGLFRGAGPTVLTNAPFSALYYLFYTRLQAALGPGGSGGGGGGGGGGGAAAQTAGGGGPAAPLVPAFAVNFVSGVVAAAAATLATQPTDVLRTRMQLGLGAGGAAPSAAAALAQVLRAQGPAALLTGVGPRAAKRVLQTALVWTLYEELAPRLAVAGGRAREMMVAAGVGGEDEGSGGKGGGRR
jgi:solute carrier family 25 protein 38